MMFLFQPDLKGICIYKMNYEFICDSYKNVQLLENRDIEAHRPNILSLAHKQIVPESTNEIILIPTN